ncbi:hypothetical protein Cgig2_012480 [Carnegiea gigantea]|uniref:SKP1 component dimerisation domain-containing protein n=1 Tax=Carnegiea gigantea TaxID=171969 RepID=A0A9Q1K6B9_9CARY|nr:hypothetical protein Cgig2_012480 [Carnegiea gigantea]
MAVVKPEVSNIQMKSYVWLQTADGSIQQVEEEIAMFCPIICREILQKSMGSCKTNAIMLPERVNPSNLGLILDYCRFHQVPGHSIKERKAFDDRFIRLDTKKLCELTSAADSLQLKPLVDLTSRTLARIIEGKSPEEIREIFNLPDDLTEEEKLEPLKNVADDPRIRLLNRLYARKRKELREREEKKVLGELELFACTSGAKGVEMPCADAYFDSYRVIQIAEVEGEHVDKRSVDDLLSFINGEDKDPKRTKAVKTKKKNRRKKPHTKMSNGDNKEVNGLPHSCLNDKAVDSSVSASGLNSELHNYMTSFSPKLDFDDGDIDDELDPVMKEELDREVEDFARRLNSDWPERMQEILSLGQGRRLTSISLSTNGLAQRYTSKLYFSFNIFKMLSLTFH